MGPVTAFRVCDGEVESLSSLPMLNGLGMNISSLAEDHDFELYLIYGSGGIVRIVAQ